MGSAARQYATLRYSALLTRGRFLPKYRSVPGVETVHDRPDAYEPGRGPASPQPRPALRAKLALDGGMTWKTVNGGERRACQRVKRAIIKTV